MWNSEAPLELLKSMPAELDIDNLKNIQKTIDIDKYHNSYSRKRDLCGGYAPFCKNCDKSIKYPCAVAYVKMKHAEGMQVEIAAAAYIPAEPNEEELEAQELNEIEEFAEVEEANTTDKKYIRIAIARRKY